MFPNSLASIISCFQYTFLYSFEMLIEKEYAENDEDFLIFEVKADIATLSKS